jgi:hypothetical protein
MICPRNQTATYMMKSIHDRDPNPRIPKVWVVVSANRSIFRTDIILRRVVGRPRKSV